jgi:hypothetical protein
MAVPSAGYIIVITGLPASAPGSTAVIGSIPSLHEENISNIENNPIKSLFIFFILFNFFVSIN